MALSGSFSKYPVGSFGLYCTWSADQSVSGNYSNVTVTVYLSHYSLSAGSRSNSTISCSGQTTYTYTSPAVNYGTNKLTSTLLGSTTFKVAHETDGTKSVTLSASWQFNGTYSGTYVGTITASATITLDSIPRQSSISSVTSSVEVNGTNAVTVNLTRYLSSYTHTVTFSIGSYSYTATGVGTSTSYAIPVSWLNAIPNNTSGTVTVTVTTFSGSTQIGVATSGTFTITIPDTAKYYPSIENIVFTRKDIEPSTWPITQGVSKGTMSMINPKGVYGSTISTYSLTFAGLTSSSSTLEVNNISSSGTLNAVAKITDSRGRSTTKEVDFEVAAYTKPKLTVDVFRSDSSGTEDPNGDYMSIRVDVDITPIGDNAVGSITLQYFKRSGGSPEFSMLNSGIAKVVPASSDYTWDWVILATDRVSTVDSKGTLGTGEVILDVRADGKGIGLGKVSESEGIDSAWEFSVGGNPQVDFVVEQGTSGSWAYRKWKSGRAEAWTTSELSFSATPSSLIGGYYANTSIGLPGDVFNNSPNCIAMGRVGTGLGFASAYSSSNTNVSITVFGNQNSATSYITALYAIGTWY